MVIEDTGSFNIRHELDTDHRVHLTKTTTSLCKPAITTGCLHKGTDCLRENRKLTAILCMLP